MLPLEHTLEEQLAPKEEWRTLQARRAQLQGTMLQDTQCQLEQVQGQLKQLREDFVYNLQLLEERDLELERYDAAFAQARLQEHAQQAEASELRIEVAKLRQELALKARQAQELQQQYQRALQEHHLELEHLHSLNSGDVDRHREQYEKLQCLLEKRLQELDGALVLQRQELLLNFESEMHRKERESRLKVDAMSNAVLTQELKVKLLTKELEALRGASAEAAESLQRAETANVELEHEVARKDQELQDLMAVKDARIKELEGKLHSAQLTRAKEEEMFKKKHEQLDRVARERDAVLASVKEAHVEQLQALELRVLELQAHSESLEARLRRAEWGQADAARDHDAVVARLQEEASALRSAWDAQVVQLSKEAVSKDLQIHGLQEEEMKLRAQSARLQQDIERYKQQLAAAVGREQSLQRDKVQLELDWQRRCDAAERDQYLRSEDLIQGLSTARERVAARLQEAERKLCDKEEVLRALALERDQAVHTLKMHGLVPEREAQMHPRPYEEGVSQAFPSSEIQRLQEQNASLRSAVAQMRKEMEALSDQVLPSAHCGGRATDRSQPDPEAANSTIPDVSVLVRKAGADGTPDPDAAVMPVASLRLAPALYCVLALGTEMGNLKHKLKALEEQFADMSDHPKTSSAELQPPVYAASESPVLQGSAMQAEVVPTVLACRKMAGRVRLLGCLVSRLRQKILQKPPEMDTIWLQLPREVDQVHVEVMELDKQVAELEKHLTTQKEGEEVVSGTQLRALENPTLREQGATGGQPEGPGVLAPQPTEHPTELQPQQQLQAAARSVLCLQRQNQPCVEAGNRLRAALGCPQGVTPPGSAIALSRLQMLLAWCHACLGGNSETLPGPSCSPAPKAWSPGVETGPPPGRGLRLEQVQLHVSVQSQPRTPMMTCKATQQKENLSPRPLQAQKLQEENDPHTQRSWSLANSSLQDTWKLLELGSSPSSPTSQDDSHPAWLHCSLCLAVGCPYSAPAPPLSKASGSSEDSLQGAGTCKLEAVRLCPADLQLPTVRISYSHVPLPFSVNTPMKQQQLFASLIQPLHTIQQEELERSASKAASSSGLSQSLTTAQRKVAIEGKKVDSQPKPKPTRQPHSAKAKGRGRQPRIRNYNQKD
ncbi:coiled-coil domain-containing protein 57 [Rhynchocyon petersi]